MHKPPDRNFNLIMIALAVLNFSSHLEEHLLPTVLMASICLGWRLLYEFQKLRLPNVFVKTILICSAFLIVYKVYGTLLGIEAATALLVSSVALKFVDSVSYRDAMIVLFLNFMLLMARFLTSQTLLMTVFAVLNLIVVTALLFHLHRGKEVNFSFANLIRNGFLITLKTTPLLVLLFVVFPRFSAGFFSLRNQNVAKSGFSGKLEPGEVSKLILSDETAFRVDFDNFVPPQRDRYWRGQVLATNYGMKWEVSLPLHKKLINYKPNLMGTTKQVITLEPTYGKWLFGLDKPIWLSFGDWYKQSGIVKYSANIFRTKADNGQRLMYQVYSDSDAEEELEEQDLRFYLRGVKNATDKVKELAQNLKKDTKNNKEIANNLLRFFAKEFRYTIQPGALKTNTVDEFIFEKKQGFCEHFAASFAYLMRAAGVPSRVVLGFHGAQQNEMGDYYIVKEKDAHAWAEIWLAKENRWFRVDPTEVVAPMRIQLGGEVFHSLPEDVAQSGSMSQVQLQELYNASWFNRYFGKAQLVMDVLALKWNQFLLNYDSQGQKNFLRKVGLQWFTKRKLGFLVLGTLVSFLFWIRYKSIKKSKDLPIDSLYKEFSKVMEPYELKRLPSEGPMDYFKRCQNRFTSLNLEPMRDAFVIGRYGPKPLELHEISELKRSLKKLSKDLNCQQKGA